MTTAARSTSITGISESLLIQQQTTTLFFVIAKIFLSLGFPKAYNTTTINPAFNISSSLEAGNTKFPKAFTNRGFQQARSTLIRTKRNRISPETASGGPCLPSSKFSAPLLVSSTLEPGKRACAIFCAACPGSLRSTNAH